MSSEVTVDRLGRRLSCTERDDMASSFLSENQFECPICIDLFNNPVSLPCGHNFCDGCIREHWKDKCQPQCPLCKEAFSKALKLCVNTLFRDFVDNYRREHVLEDRERPVGAGDVLCDCCLHARRRAARTCLVCLTSYCAAHLEPHLRLPALKAHTLTDPVPRLEEKICTKHNRILEEGCGGDGKPGCILCAREVRDRPGDNVKDAESKPEGPLSGATRAKAKKSKSKKKTKGGDDDTEGLGNVNVWHNFRMYTFSPISLQRGFSSGRVYYSVPLIGKGSWELGVCNETTTNRKKRPKAFGQWTVRYNIHFNCPQLCYRRDGIFQDRVLVCVDYEEGLMFLINPLDGVVFFCFTDCRFKGRLVLCAREDRRNLPVSCPFCKTSTFWTWSVQLLGSAIVFMCDTLMKLLS